MTRKPFPPISSQEPLHDTFLEDVHRAPKHKRKLGMDEIEYRQLPIVSPNLDETGKPISFIPMKRISWEDFKKRYAVGPDETTAAINRHKRYYHK